MVSLATLPSALGAVAIPALAGGAAFVLAAALVGLVRHYALRQSILDHPNERSSHAQPIPRGGGAGVVAAVAIVFVVVLRQFEADWRLLVALLAVLPTAAVGWIDDRGGVAVRTRIVVHFGASFLLLPLALSGVSPLWLRIAIGAWWVFATVSAINVVNFMDGLDGFIGLQAAIFGLHLLRLASGDVVRSFGAVFAGAAVGFLLWNWPRAKIFLGDVGSGPLGLLGVVGGLAVLREGRWGVAATFLPLVPIFLDATLTIVARARRGERLSEAHRSHLYQRLANAGLGHAPVTMLYGLAAALGAVMVHVVPDSAGEEAYVVYATYALLVLLGGWLLGRRLRRVESRTVRTAGGEPLADAPERPGLVSRPVDFSH